MEENKVDSVEPVNDGSAIPQESQNQVVSDNSSDTVKYDTYRRTLSEAKKYKSKVDELQEQLTVVQQSQMQAEGKKDELIESLRKQNADLQGKFKSAVGNFAQGKAMDAIVDEAVKAGCTSTALLKKAIAEEIETLEFDDGFNPNRDQVAMLIEKARKEHSVLFSKDAPKMANHSLNPTSAVQGSEKKPLSKMSDDELMAAWGKVNR